MSVESRRITLEYTDAALQKCLFVGRIAASAVEGEFGYQEFSRDAEAVADHYLEDRPELALGVLDRVPIEQGDKYDWRTDEQPGRFPHQVAYNVWGEGDDRIELAPDVIAEHRKWPDRWGVPFDKKKGFVIFNQTDGIFYVHLLHKTINRFRRVPNAPNILQRTINHKSGKPRTIEEATLYNMDWAVGAYEKSDAGLYEVAESNPRQTSWSGQRNDGNDAWWHLTGSIGTTLPYKIEMGGGAFPGEGNDHTHSITHNYADMYPGCKVNKDEPMAYWGNQVLFVQVLCDAIALFKERAESDPAIRRRVKKWEEILHVLPQNAFERFRWDDHSTFYPVLDRSRDGEIRPVKLESSTIAETLKWKEMYNRIGASDKTVQVGEVVGGVFKHVLSRKFMTSAGTTMLNQDYTAHENHVTYQGGAAVWPIQQEEIATSLDAWEACEPAYDLRTEHLLPSLEKAAEGGDDCPEYFVRRGDTIGYVCRDERVGGREGDRGHYDSGFVIVAEQRRSIGQAWTGSSAHHALLALRRGRRQSSGWQKDVNKAFQGARSQIIPASRDKNRTYFVDLESGKHRAERRISRMGELDPSRGRWSRLRGRQPLYR